jgi:hypothetical protein
LAVVVVDQLLIAHLKEIQGWVVQVVQAVVAVATAKTLAVLLN